MLKIEHYSKVYPGGKVAVDDLSLHVRPGEIYGFIGHNGAGKTTTLRAVAGVMEDYAAANLAGHQATVGVLQELLSAVLGIRIGEDLLCDAAARYNGKMAVVRGGYV